MKKSSFWLSLIVLIASWNSANAAPALDVKCAIVRDGFVYGYCTHQVKGSLSNDVLYYFHSGGSSEYEWQRAPQISKVYDAWGINAPTVITISYGSTWLLAEKNRSSRSGLFEHLTNRAIPYLEDLLKITPAHRLIAGASMGGFNASQLYLKRPDLFSRAALLCPALSTVSPYDSTATINAYISRTHAYGKAVRRALYLSSLYYPDQNSWLKAAPISVAAEVVTPAHPPVFVSVGSSDQFGFFEGGSEFAHAVQQKGAVAEWSLVNGGHCSFDVPGVIEFMTQAFPN